MRNLHLLRRAAQDARCFARPDDLGSAREDDNGQKNRADGTSYRWIWLNMSLPAGENPEEGKVVRQLVEEIRSKKYYVPELELVMINENDAPVGYAMFSRFHIEGRYENELLILTPVAVKRELQRQHVSKDLLEYGFEKARELCFKAVLVEGDPKNYVPRGFQPSYRFGIEAGPNMTRPHPECLMVKELEYPSNLTIWRIYPVLDVRERCTILWMY